MLIFNGTENIEEAISRPIITVGNFDGVHIGHLCVIEMVVERARNVGGSSVVMTFDPHPRTFFNPDSPVPMITTRDQKRELIENLGVDVLIEQPFDNDFASLTAEDFVVKTLLDKVGAVELIVSHKFKFGRHAAGDVDLLAKLAKEHGFALTLIGNLLFRDTLVASSFIRETIDSGEMELATSLLGRPYRIEGDVYPDTKRGTELLNCPTSNVRPENELIPATGIYASAVALEGRRIPAATYIGDRPTFEGDKRVIETHLLDFSGSLYGQRIGVEFFKKMREDMKFESIGDLQRQIGTDIRQIREYLHRHATDPNIQPLHWSEGGEN